LALRVRVKVLHSLSRAPKVVAAISSYDSENDRKAEAMKKDFDERWEQLAAEVLTGMKEWRWQHPRATLREIELTLDEKLGNLRARLLEDMALASAAREWCAEDGVRPQCPQCQTALQSRGSQTRWLQTQQGQELELSRSYGTCPHCGAGFFPLG
jgi:hypothetical protein